MDILYLLIPLSVLLMLLVIGVFGWALHRGQFDDLDDEGLRILRHDEERSANFDMDQLSLRRGPEQSPPTSRPVSGGVARDDQ
jgi:cbb3-type cytochrome oxidase maturation protein